MTKTTKNLTAAERRQLEALIAKIKAAKSVADLGDCDRLAATLQPISDRDDDDLAVFLSNAEHGVSDIDMIGEDFEEGAEYAVAMIERILEWKPRRKAA